MNHRGRSLEHPPQSQGNQAIPQESMDNILSKPKPDAQNASYSRLSAVLSMTAGVRGQDESYTKQFMLHFLCDVEMRGTRLAQYPGNTPNNPCELDKRGLHLLCMLYMAKYGSQAEDFVVPPSTHLRPTTDPEDFGVAESIGRLVDELTVRLGEPLGDNVDVTNQMQGASELGQVRLYLKTEGNARTCCRQ
ncbi:MAG: hypothetical protein J3Q66DRAFT_389399 [Benniella sp.]|nr:MAG: hypothetical protein J3Q66DRAFT_389399 [Benniella sp.]